MILYVDMEHESGREAAWGERVMAGRIKVKYRLEQIAARPCLIAHYSKVNPAFLRQFDFQAVVLSGSATDPEHYTDLQGVQEVIRQAPIPTLGLCGGWQFMAEAFGGEITPLGPLDPGETAPEAAFILKEGMKQEFGFVPVRVTGSHPLMAGLGDSPSFWQAHYLEVSPPPPGFRVYAQTAACATQMVAHEDLPLYGTQFHPEYYDNEHTDGRRVLENFFRLAGVIETPQ